MDVSEYKLVRSKRRSLSIQIGHDGTVVVKAPYLVPKILIDKFVIGHQDWIRKHSQKIISAKSFKSEDEYLYLGRAVIFTPGNFQEIGIKKDRLCFPQALLFRKEKEIHTWYLREARTIITQQLKKFASEMDARYSEVIFSDTTSQWGRCTRDNRLQFSWRLIMAPILTINYVVIHELAHTFEKNHSPAFWAIVRRFTPSYRQQIRWLTAHSPQMHMIVD